LAWEESNGIAVEPFVGRGAALNRAIFYVLGCKQPQTTRQISKSVKSIPDFKGTSTSTVNKRVRDLEKHGYLQKVQVTQRVGGITNYYELTPQADLNKFLDANKALDLFTGLSREMATIILADLIKAKEEKEDKKTSIL
jgi:DNA-binding PadR family transcriptional regulator